jgi:hypothetical protein
MQLFRLNPAKCDERFCFVRGVFRYDTELQEGEEVLAQMLDRGVDALEYRLDEVRGGLEIGDYFTTRTNHLPVTRRCADAMSAEFKLQPLEAVPARIKNEKGRVHVPDVVILNPLGKIDCLDWEKSELDDDPDDLMVDMFGKWSLKKKRVPTDRDIFRVKGLIGYVFSEPLVDFIRKKKFKNFEFENVALS